MKEEEKMTPSEHLGEAERLLAALEDQVKTRAQGSAMAVPDVIALVNAHVTLALALNAIPFLGDAAAILREDREETTRYLRELP